MWECAEGFSDELLGSYFPKMSRPYNNILSRSYLSPATFKTDEYEYIRNESPYMNGWHSIIYDYRARNLTQAKDRNMAFGGVARAFGAEHGFTYLAGAWAEFLPFDLMWHVEDEDIINELTMIEAGSTQTPSWSWLGQPKYEKRTLAFRYHLDIGEPIALFVTFERLGEPIDHVSDTRFYDFTSLRL